MEAAGPVRVQAYLAAMLAVRTEPHAVGPWTAHLHPDGPRPRAEWAVPAGPEAAEPEAIAALRAFYAEHGRRAGVEYVDAAVPELRAALRQAGFELLHDAPLMVRPAAPPPAPVEVPGLALTAIRPGADPQDARDFLAVKFEAFGVDQVPPADAAGLADALAWDLGGGEGFLGRIGGAAAGAGQIQATHGGLAEVVAIATAPPFRRRGVGAAMTAAAAGLAAPRGAETVFLSAADEATTRIYARAGFQRAGSVLGLRDPG
ncbi:MAG: GNAT family N-acetyltransferase [Solirubrobacteraceae bacterium]